MNNDDATTVSIRSLAGAALLEKADACCKELADELLPVAIELGIPNLQTYSLVVAIITELDRLHKQNQPSHPSDWNTTIYSLASDRIVDAVNAEIHALLDKIDLLEPDGKEIMDQYHNGLITPYECLNKILDHLTKVFG